MDVLHSLLHSLWNIQYFEVHLHQGTFATPSTNPVITH